MKVSRSHLVFVLVILSLVTTVAGQVNSATNKNNPYSPSPAGKVTPTTATRVAKPMPSPAATPTWVGPQQVAFVTKDSRTADRQDVPAISEPKAFATELPAKSASIYRIGVGDVLFINLKNSAQGSGYYTVREDGVIEYPLAGPMVSIASKTTDEVSAMLRASIKLFADPQVEVKVQYYLSRFFTVTGLADNPGEKVLRREAMPVFAIRAESEVRREANTIKITRSKSENIETFSLTDATTDNVLIFAGDQIEFVEEKRTEIAQFTISGAKKPLVAGTKLLQAVADARGAKAEPKLAVIHRINDKGVTTLYEYEVKAIRKGKVIDPVLSPGDVIEIKN